MLRGTARAGEFDRLVTFIRKSKSVGSANSDYVDSWIALPSDPAQYMRKRDLPGREMEVAGQLTSVQKTMFTGRYRDDLTTEDRLKCEGKIYQIVSITEPQDTRRQFIDVTCMWLQNETT